MKGTSAFLKETWSGSGRGGSVERYGAVWGVRLPDADDVSATGRAHLQLPVPTGSHGEIRLLERLP